MRHPLIGAVLAIPIASFAMVPPPTAILTAHQIMSMSHRDIQQYCKERATVAASITKPDASIPPTFAQAAVTIKQAHFTAKQAYQWMDQQCPIQMLRIQSLMKYMIDLSHEMNQDTKVMKQLKAEQR